MLALLAKVALASAALVAICWASRHWLLAHWATQLFMGKLLALMLTVIVGAVAFFGCGAALHIDELHTLKSAIARRLRRVG